MEDFAGRARVYDQDGDDPETIMEAIDCCPVNCISCEPHQQLTADRATCRSPVFNIAARH